jgi:hypothetical protein
MLQRALFVLFVLVLALPGESVAGQDPTGNARKSSAATKVVENWKSLGDIHTGLEPRPPLLVERDEEQEFVREFIRLQWRPADPIDLWLMRPKIPGRVPVVLYLYGYADDTDRFRDNGWCKRATANGFAAVGFVSALTGQRYHNRPMKQWFVSELEEALGSSAHDVQLILNYLAGRQDLDMEHVGMFGMGSGATIAILSAEADPRIKALDLLDPWGDWPDWLRQSPVVPENERPQYTTDQFLYSLTTLDPITLLPGLKTQKIRLQQTLTDALTPQRAKERIASSLPNNAQLVRYMNSEEHLKAWQQGGLSGWIKGQLRLETQASVGMRGGQP